MNNITEEELTKALTELSITVVGSALSVINEIAARCNNFDEFKICLSATVKNLKGETNE